MAKKKEETLVVFREAFELTSCLTDEQLGRLMRGLFCHRFGLEAKPEKDPVVSMALGFIAAQSDRYETYCRQNREAAKNRYQRSPADAPEENPPAAPDCSGDTAVEQTEAPTVSEGTQGTTNDSETPQTITHDHNSPQNTTKHHSTSTSTSTSTSNNIFGNILLERPPPAAQTQVFL